MAARSRIGALTRCGAMIAALALAAACERTEPAANTVPAPAAEEPDALPPPILPPTESSDPAATPSYEVAIATAAAERNRAIEKCAEMPRIERTTCEEQATAEFEAAEAGLEDLRGNQQ